MEDKSEDTLFNESIAAAKIHIVESTNNLRFYNGVLQQEHRVATIDYSSVDFEWRDVPQIKEEQNG